MKKTTRKTRNKSVRAAVAIALTATTVCFAGCKNGKTEKTVLTVWCSQLDSEIAKSIAKEFNAERGGAYEFRFAAQGENEIATKILTDVEAAPDVFSFPGDSMIKLIAGDALARVGGERLERLKESNDEEAMDAASVTLLDGSTATYAFPYTDNTFFLYYNKSCFSPSDVQSLDGILGKCSKKQRFAMPLNDGWYTTAFYFGANLGYDVTYNENFAETKITTDFGNETGKKVTRAIYEVVSDGRVLPDADDSAIAAGFADGSVIAATSGIWNKSTIESYLGDDFAVAKLPTYTFSRGEDDEEQKQLTAFAGYKMMGVGQYSKAKAAAFDFAEFYTNRENQIKRFKARGFVPTNKEARKEQIVLDDPCARAIAEQLRFSKVQKNVPSTLWTPMQGLGNAMIAAAANGSAFKTDTELAACVKAIEKR